MGNVHLLFGSDGAFLEFRPLASQVSDLPPFVRNRLSDSFSQQISKNRLRGKIRMETPVVYFYTDKVREVEVDVQFPRGLLTEFYPPVDSMLPVLNEAKATSSGEDIGNIATEMGQSYAHPRG